MRVDLPVKAGDEIYQLRGKRHALGPGISQRIVSCVVVWSPKKYSVIHQGAEPCNSSDLGKTWFLSFAEAEATLKSAP